MWTHSNFELEPGRVTQVTLEHDSAPMSYADVIEHWRDDTSFRRSFTELLAAVPYDAYFWETPPVSRTTLAQSFEFIICASHSLDAMHPDPGAFAEYFRRGPASVATFRNLGGDACLVAPAPLSEDHHYVHLARFVRGAPHEQQHELWRCVAQAVAESLGDAPLWLSTCGTGIGWLHVRIDSTPKYYTHTPYRHAV